jgi:hypothetical protein
MTVLTHVGGFPAQSEKGRGQLTTQIFVRAVCPLERMTAK